MLLGWPLRAPPQIAADSYSEDVDPSWEAMDIPVRSDGTYPDFILITWESASQIWVRVRSVQYGWAIHGYAQPLLLCVRGNLLHQISVWMATGTVRVHITPLEE